MRPWFTSLQQLHGAGEDVVGRPDMLQWAHDAIREAEDALPDVDTLLLIDLGTDVATAVVGMPIRHVHGQRCARA